jgi:hypothetical protein
LSIQLANVVSQLSAGEDDLSIAVALGGLIQNIECSDPEKVILAALATATLKPGPLYSADLASAVKGRELAAIGLVTTLRDVAVDTGGADAALAMSLARELAGVLKIVANDAVALLDGPMA